MFNDEYLKFIYEFKKIWDRDEDNEEMVAIKEDVCKLIVSTGLKQMSRVMFDEHYDNIVQDVDWRIPPEHKILAFILNLTNIPMYHTDFNFKSYILLNDDLDHVFTVLYDSQYDPLNRLFNDEFDSEMFFYDNVNLLPVFIENKIISRNLEEQLYNPPSKILRIY